MIKKIKKRIASFVEIGNILKEIHKMQNYYNKEVSATNGFNRGIYFLLRKYQHRKIYCKFACDIINDSQIANVSFPHPTGIVIGGGSTYI